MNVISNNIREIAGYLKFYRIIFFLKYLVNYANFDKKMTDSPLYWPHPWHPNVFFLLKCKCYRSSTFQGTILYALIESFINRSLKKLTFRSNNWYFFYELRFENLRKIENFLIQTYNSYSSVKNYTRKKFNPSNESLKCLVLEYINYMIIYIILKKICHIEKSSFC